MADEKESRILEARLKLRERFLKFMHARGYLEQYAGDARPAREGA